VGVAPFAQVYEEFGHSEAQVTPWMAVGRLEGRMDVVPVLQIRRSDDRDGSRTTPMNNELTNCIEAWVEYGHPAAGIEVRHARKSYLE
jgi:hypothetical protein